MRSSRTEGDAARHGVLLAVCGIALALLASSLPAWAGEGTAGSSGRLPDTVAPLHYEIFLEPDAAALSFEGRETVTIEVRQETAVIVLNAVDLAIRDVALDGRIPATVTLDSEQQTAKFSFATPVGVGSHRLDMAFTGRIEQNAAGLFALDYGTPDGTRRMLTTQFEPLDGRRFAPMWDEPAAKATFALEVAIPADEVAFSNMPEASSRVVGEKRHVRFQTTPKMSSYLLHLTIGDLERVSRKVAGVDVGVVTRKGATAMADFALESAARILPWYHDYFDTPYPLPKLDMIAAPGESQFFGAMENWGAILYFEHVLLIDPARSSESDRQGVFEVVAHEVAHQWFGNLVTMRWWDDLWLNEGFASWMASRITDALHPEWQPWLQLVGGSRETAMQLDAGAATHAIVQPVNSIAAINQAFDAIAYSKGEAVIRMLEEAVGVAGFRDGIRRYMRRHAYGNAVTDDLWRAVEEATGKPVTGIAHGFTRQPGVPLVTAGEASCRAGTTSIALAQSRFETDERSARQHSWHIPVRLQAIGSTARTETLMTPGEPVQLSLAGCGPLLVNSGQAGYFRTLYPPEEVVRLRDAFARIPGVDQLGLLSDAWALGQTGTIPVSNYLDFASVVQPDADPLVWRDIARQFALIDRMLDGSPEQAAWRGIARSRLRPQFDRVGWTRQPGQTDSVALLRESLITSLGALHDSSLLAQARSRFLRAPQDPAALPAGIRLSVLDVTARHADEETWQEILSRARAEKEPIERHRLYSRLGLALDPVLARHALDLALSGEPPATVAPSIIKTVADQHPALAFEFATANESAVQRLVEAGSRWSFIPLLARTSADLDLVRQLRAYVAKTLAEDARKDANEVVAEIERRARTRAMARPQVEAWIRDQTSRD